MQDDVLKIFSQISVYGLYCLYILTVIEAIFLIRKMPESFDGKEAAVSLLSEFTPIALNYLALGLSFSLIKPIMVFAWENRINTIDVNTVSGVLAAYLFGEFIYYWQHRALHRVRWFWLDHAVHHSSNRLNLTAAWRMGLTSRVVGATIFFVPMIWLGFGLNAIVTVFGVFSLYQTLLHTEWFPKLGVLEGFLMTPSLHRVHHGSNPEYLDCNYGSTLCIYDRIFGTYVAERSDVAIRFGLVEPLKTNNPLIVYFHQWIYLARDLKSVKGFKSLALLLLMPPEWLASQRPKKSESLLAEKSACPLSVPVSLDRR